MGIKSLSNVGTTRRIVIHHQTSHYLRWFLKNKMGMYHIGVQGSGAVMSRKNFTVRRNNMSVTSPYYCRDIEEAVKDNDAVEDPAAMIERHNKRVEREYRKALAGQFLEKSVKVSKPGLFISLIKKLK